MNEPQAMPSSDPVGAPADRYRALLEPIRLGPAHARNRFYQVPHCSGMGWRHPRALSAMRGEKAAGGWGVVSTEYCSIHPSSDDLAFLSATLWDDGDVAANALMTEAVHAQGALANVELWHGGGSVANLGTRLPAFSVSGRGPLDERHHFPTQSRRLDREDRARLRRWHADAARRAAQAGFDIVTVYAAHGYLVHEILEADAAEGVALVRALIEEAREATAGRLAIACRFAVARDAPATLEAFAALAETPDLWDLVVPDYGVEMGASRFVGEGALQDDVRAAKALTTKPVVAVGRYTTPDAMLAALVSGAQDLIGAARPSIADPHLPRKIAEGRLDEIRECIGCNVCYATNSLGVPIRCTQNPTMGEEWRLGWRPESVPPARRAGHVLVIGAGPSGLEAARVAAERGYRVTLAEATRTLGGRVTRESRLPGLAAWARVRDWRVGRLAALAERVEIYRESRLSAEEALAVGADHLLVATGARWRTDVVGRWRDRPLKDASGMVVSADAVIDGATPPGRVLIYDEEHYYLAGALALALVGRGAEVVIATPAGRVGGWGLYTEELYPATAALLAAGVRLVTNVGLEAVSPGVARLACVFSGALRDEPADAVVPLTMRAPQDALYDALRALGAPSLRKIGDCDAPSIVAAAVWSGHRAGRELDETIDEAAAFGRRERPALREEAWG